MVGVIRGQVNETMELAVAQEDSWRNIPITLIEPGLAARQTSMSVIAWLRRFC
jgi:hypothetical protein